MDHGRDPLMGRLGRDGHGHANEVNETASLLDFAVLAELDLPFAGQTFCGGTGCLLAKVTVSSNWFNLTRLHKCAHATQACVA